MFQKFKITFYSLIVLLFLVLPSHAAHTRGGWIGDHPADSCKGWNCSYEEQVCPQGAEGARGTSFICLNSKWVPTYCEESTIIEGLFGFAFFHKQSVAQSAAEHSGALCAGGGVIK